MRHIACLPLALTVIAGCNSGGSGSYAAPMPVFVGVPGVTLTRVAFYQGLERDLMRDGAAVAPSLPIVAGREAMVRLFYATDAGYDGGEVTARITTDDGTPIDLKATLSGTSQATSLGSTVNVPVPGDRIGASLTFSAWLGREITPSGGTAPPDNVAARWPADGKQPIAVEARKNTLRIVIVPIAYNYDRSGRLPNLDPPQVENIRRRFQQLYPVSNVTIDIHEAIPWQRAIQPNGAGWAEIGDAMAQLRAAEGAGEDVYYYGMFNPAATEQQFCSRGCVLGLTAQEQGAGYYFIIGAGYEAVAAETAVHEVGHAHGLNHANCGQGLDPRSIDRNFPYAGGKIGVWGYDAFGKRLIAPDRFIDIMGYCPNTWISDYHYGKLSDRGQAVNLESRPAGPREADAASILVEHDVIQVDGEGNATIAAAPVRLRPHAAAGVPVRLDREDGTTADVRGHYFAYDHLPGGVLVIPRGAALQATAAPARAQFVLDGRPHVAIRR